MPQIKTNLSPITLDESKRLLELERIIEAGRQTFIEVGIALAEIRDSRLYKSEHKTFEDYCVQKWGWTRQHCYRLIECAPVAKCNPQVTSINQARELAKVPQDQRAAVIKQAVVKSKSAGRQLTAKDIQAAATPETITPDVEAQPEPNFKREFPAASTSQRKAEAWWYSRVESKKRGYFLNRLISMHQPVLVENKEAFAKRIMQWLADDVSETEEASPL